MRRDDFEQFRCDYYAMTGTMARLAMEKKARSGIYPHRLPIGYKRKFVDGEERIEIDPETAPLVELAFDLAAHKNSSLSKVLAAVRAKGLKGHSGESISRSALHRMLTNRFYCGELKYKGESLTGAHRALISHEHWNRASVALRVRLRPSAIGSLSSRSTRNA